MDRRLPHLLLVAASVATAPVWAFTSGVVPREAGAAVVADASAYVTVETLGPVSLTLLNGYEADAVRVTHRHVASTDLHVTVSRVACTPDDAGRVAVRTAPATIATAGAAAAFRVFDNTLLHTGLTCTLHVRVTADVRADGTTASLGFAARHQNVTVTVS